MSAFPGSLRSVHHFTHRLLHLQTPTVSPKLLWRVHSLHRPAAAKRRSQPATRCFSQRWEQNGFTEVILRRILHAVSSTIPHHAKAFPGVSIWFLRDRNKMSCRLSTSALLAAGVSNSSPCAWLGLECLCYTHAWSSHTGSMRVLRCAECFHWMFATWYHVSLDTDYVNVQRHFRPSSAICWLMHPSDENPTMVGDSEE